MIEVVWCVLLLFMGAECAYNYPDSQAYSYDSPYELQPKKLYKRVKIGTPITLRCHQSTAVMEYQHCKSYFQGLLCGGQDHWERLNATNGRKHIDSVDKSHNGIYKCLVDSSVRKIFIIDVVTPGYTGTKPHVAPLKTSSLTDQINMKFTIQCNVTSEVPPTIIWFKSCYGQKCDIDYNRICYCHLNNNTSISSYNIGTTYLSKYSIFNARDIDSGIYACVAVTQYGESSQNVTINVPRNVEEEVSFCILFLIPAALILIPVGIWLCYYRRKKRKTPVRMSPEQKQIFIPEVQENLEINGIV